MRQLKNKLLYWAVIVVIVGIIMLTGCQAKRTDADAPSISAASSIDIGTFFI